MLQFWKSSTGLSLLRVGIAITDPLVTFNRWAREMVANPDKKIEETYIEIGTKALEGLRSSNTDKDSSLAKAAKAYANLKNSSNAEAVILCAALRGECEKNRTSQPPNLKEIADSFNSLLASLKELPNAQ